MPAPTITEATIRQYASADSFARGDEYVRDGAVGALGRRGDVLQGEVEGSEAVPYQVRVTFDAAGVAEARCTCPYDWGGWCKHIVAVLLTALRTPGAIEERPPLSEVLEGLDRDGLLAVLVALADGDPALADRIALLAARPGPAPGATATAPKPRRSPVDTEAVRKQVRATIRGVARAQYHSGSWGQPSISGDMDSILAQAWSFIQADDGQMALAVLEALTDEYAGSWFEVDDSDGDVSGYFYDLGPAWTEAFLSVDLTDDERDEWTEKLDDWQSEASEYGIDDVFVAAYLAIKHGLDGLPVRRVPVAAPAEPSAWQSDRDDENSQLMHAALNVLDRRGRHDEYLRLAAAAGLATRHATMLVRLGRAEEAVAYARAHLATPDDALTVATALREAGEVAGALAVADHGLTLDGPRTRLATWTRDVADALGDYPRALNAALIAFRSEPTLVAYQRAEELADDTWPAHRDELLAWLRTHKTYSPQGQVDVFLHEGLIDDAIHAVAGTYSHTIVAQVVDVAVAARPDWAIATARKQAEAIMDAGKANHYDDAVRWLARARDAYRASGRPEAWAAYRDELLATHGRKYKLVPMIKALR